MFCRTFCVSHLQWGTHVFLDTLLLRFSKVIMLLLQLSLFLLIFILNVFVVELLGKKRNVVVLIGPWGYFLGFVGIAIIVRMQTRSLLAFSWGFLVYSSAAFLHYLHEQTNTEYSKLDPWELEAHGIPGPVSVHCGIDAQLCRNFESMVYCLVFIARLCRLRYTDIFYLLLNCT